VLLREFPHVRIVISSSWREQLRYETLLKPFSSYIGARILGATPHSGFGLPPPFGQREGEILAWLQIHDAVDEPWVALDDAYWQFEYCKDQLVVCGSFTGFDERQAPTFAGALKEHSDESTDPLRPPPRVRALRART